MFLFFEAFHPVDTGRILNVYKTFRRHPGHLLNVLCTFNLRPVSTGQPQNVLILFLFFIKIFYPLMLKNTPNEIIIVYCQLSLTFISVPVKDVCL